MAEYDAFASWISAYSNPILTNISLFIDIFTYPLLALLLIYLFFIKKDRKRAISICVTYAILIFLVIALKLAFTEERPCTAPWKIQCPLDYALPSGHTAAVAVLLAAYLTAPSFPITLLIYLAVSLSRIYLGVHIFKDVLAGTAMAFSVFFIVDMALSKLRIEERVNRVMGKGKLKSK